MAGEKPNKHKEGHTTPENTGPFQALTTLLRGMEWREELLPETQEKHIVWPETQAGSLSPTPRVDVAIDLNIRVITQDEITQGYCTVPMDTWNLGNFVPHAYRSEGVFKDNFMNVVERYFLAASFDNESFTRGTICFSKKEQQILLLPTITPHE